MHIILLGHELGCGYSVKYNINQRQIWIIHITIVPVKVSARLCNFNVHVGTLAKNEVHKSDR